MTRHTYGKPKKRKAIAEVFFKRSPDTWLELECGHFIRKGAHKEWASGFVCNACVAMGALN